MFMFLQDKLDPDEMAQVEQLVENIMNSCESSMASDHALGATTMVDRSTIRELQALQRAEAETGVMGMDSASGTYREACRRLGHELPYMPAEAARTAWNLARGHGARRPAAMAADANIAARRAEMFPNGNRVRRY
ncbi:MAG TPA: hypothetical protein VHO91_10610 [Rhodopila sp.]|nr:hypothetical protein [Rhodopila sp.]